MTARRNAVLLGLLSFLFLLRVAGQLAVVLFQVEWLPPMQEWQSGLLRYRYLLAAQILILLFQALVSIRLWRRSDRRPAGSLARLGCWARRFAVVYAAAMALRYLLTMALFPDQRWFGGTIPILFHFNLAAWLWWWGRTLSTPAASFSPSPRQPIDE